MVRRTYSQIFLRLLVCTFGLKLVLVFSPGTHIAGVIGASKTNNLGISGIISDDEICFVVARVFGEGGSVLTSTVLQAIDWAVDQGAKLINLSLGGGTQMTSFENTLDAAFNSGALVIAAAG
jgi:subtilisin family serine protease